MFPRKNESPSEHTFTVMQHSSLTLPTTNDDSFDRKFITHLLTFFINRAIFSFPNLRVALHSSFKSQHATLLCVRRIASLIRSKIIHCLFSIAIRQLMALVVDCMCVCLLFCVCYKTTFYDYGFGIMSDFFVAMC